MRGDRRYCHACCRLSAQLVASAAWATRVRYHAPGLKDDVASRLGVTHEELTALVQRQEAKAVRRQPRALPSAAAEDADAAEEADGLAGDAALEKETA